MKTYLDSVIVCSLTCGILSQFISGSKRKKLVHLISGTVLAITVLQPLSRINPEIYTDSLFPDVLSADCYIAQGEKTALAAREVSIAGACEAYIVEKAQRLGAVISIQFSLDENLIPNAAEIIGKLEPDVQMQLQTILTTDLGIPKENQKWTWLPENSGF